MTTSDRTRRDGAKRYTGVGIAVGYEARRCLHAAECVRGLPDVFDVERRPWIVLGETDPDRIAEVIARCPSGALQYHRTDGGPNEEAPNPTEVTVRENGVVHLRGDLRIEIPPGVRSETRVMLCGCGRTEHIPYCDHTGNACASVT